MSETEEEGCRINKHAQDLQLYCSPEKRANTGEGDIRLKLTGS